MGEFRTFVRSFICFFIHSFIDLLIYLLICLLIFFIYLVFNLQDNIKTLSTFFSVPPDLKESVYHYGVKNGGEKEWNFVFEQFTNTKVVSDKKILLYAMAGAQEPWLIER